MDQATFELLRDALNALHDDIDRLRQNRATARKETAIRLAGMSERIAIIDARLDRLHQGRGAWFHAIIRAIAGGE